MPEGMTYAVAQCLLKNRLWLGGLGDDGPVLGYVDLESGKTFLQHLTDVENLNDLTSAREIYTPDIYLTGPGVSGDCTAQQAADQIQSRVSIYLGERG